MVTEAEKQLIDKAVEGDLHAFENLVKMHRAKLRAFALNITSGNCAVADDILQEALIKAFLGIKKFQKKSGFSTWLWRIVRNELVDYHRSPSTRPTYHLEDMKSYEPEAKESTEKELIRQEKIRMVRVLVNKLPPKLLEAITLVDMQELTYEESAKILDVSLTALKARVFKGRKKLFELAQSMNEKI